MSELKKVIIVSVEEDDISVKLQVASEDYSAIYEAAVFKQTYDKDSKTWKDFTDEDTKGKERQAKALKILGGSFENIEDKVLEMYVDEGTGKAYFEEGTAFKKIDKPLVSLKRLKKVPIVEIKDSAKGRAVIVEHEDKYYSFNFNSGVYIEKLNKFIPNQAKLAKAKARFNELFEDVNVTWDTAEMAIGMVVDCTVNKNMLDPKSQYGWLEAQPLDPDDQKEVVTEEELPF